MSSADLVTIVVVSVTVGAVLGAMIGLHINGPNS